MIVGRSVEVDPTICFESPKIVMDALGGLKTIS